MTLGHLPAAEVIVVVSAYSLCLEDIKSTPWCYRCAGVRFWFGLSKNTYRGVITIARALSFPLSRWMEEWMFIRRYDCTYSVARSKGVTEKITANRSLGYTRTHTRVGVCMEEGRHRAQ